MSCQHPPLAFKVLKKFLQWVYPTPRISGLENVDEPVIFVGNHCQLHGPLIAELFFPENRMIWCAGEMMHLKEVPAYAFLDFWSQKPRRSKPYYKLMSYLIAPLAAFIFQNAHTIGVRRDSRLRTTFKETINALETGNHVVIFPEHDVKHNHIVYEFEENFVDVARLYYRHTGKALAFVPLYIAPRIRTVTAGAPIRFSPDAPVGQERTRIARELMVSVTALAEAQPLHTVVPYRNIPKKDYPKNKGANR